MAQQMNMVRPSLVRQALNDLQIKPSKSLGQNFLIDGNIRNLIIDAAQAGEDDQVLEVGPGLGALTEVLLEQVRKLTVIEKDGRLCTFLEQRFHGHPRMTLHHGDVLEVGVQDIIHKDDIKIMVSNLPYRIAGRLLMDLFRMEAPLERIVVTLQADVAEKIIAQPSTGEYGPMAVWGQRVYEVDTVRRIKPVSFYPRPRVESICLLLVRRRNSRIASENSEELDALLKTAFSQRRKTMFNAMVRYGFDKDKCAGLLDTAMIGHLQRPEDVGREKWEALARLCRLSGNS